MGDIIIKIMGGLGNQMFQYAFGLSMNTKYKFNVTYDMSFYKNKLIHDGILINRVFNLSYFVEASPREIFQKKDFLPLLKIRKKIDLVRKKHFIEKKFLNAYDNLSKYSYFEGYFQNPTYFSDIQSVIKNEFLFSKDLSKKNMETLKLIEVSNSCSVHIRRGDYLKLSQYDNICTFDYYNKAFTIIEKSNDSILYVFFSNDIAWCKNNFADKNAIFVDWNTTSNSYIDMYLMSKCKHNIIANSSFSWWGAYLNDNPKKIVIAPSKWINNDSGNPSLIDWIKI